MVWRLELDKSAAKQVRDLPKPMQVRVTRALATLVENPRGAANVKALVGREGYRLRVGDYRVLYLLDDADEAVRVTTVGHRGHVYD
jgi:mRNA interferase RelE/StbE